MAVRRSAALLVFLLDPTHAQPEAPEEAPNSGGSQLPGLHLFLAHMGGPLWGHRDVGAWSIPKGEYGPEEPAAQAAIREFREEIGADPPDGELLDLGECRQPSGKQVRTFAVAGTRDLRFVASNTFQMEWPRGSGRVRSFPEVDDARWFPLAAAREKILPGQLPILAELAKRLGIHDVGDG